MGSDADDDEDADFEDLVEENERRERDGGTPDPLLQRDGQFVVIIDHHPRVLMRLLIL